MQLLLVLIYGEKLSSLALVSLKRLNRYGVQLTYQFDWTCQKVFD